MAEKKTKAPKNEAPQEKKAAKETKAEAKETKAKAELAALQADYAELNDKHLRTLAEYENYRKRSTKEKSEAWENSKADVLKTLLPVLDNFDRALGNKEAELEDYQKGVEMIYSQLLDILNKLGAESYGEAGEEFDPNIHSAVMHTEDESQPENTITDVFSKGYKLGDKILRAAVVKVVN